MLVRCGRCAGLCITHGAPNLTSQDSPGQTGKKDRIPRGIPKHCLWGKNPREPGGGLEWSGVLKAVQTVQSRSSKVLGTIRVGGMHAGGAEEIRVSTVRSTEYSQGGYYG